MSLIKETLASFQSRLKELETQIAPLATEADELRAAIARLEGDGARGRGRPAASRSSSSRRKPRRTASGRAPRGQAREAILKAAKEHPEATSGEIANLTGLARNTVATTMSKLRAAGELPKRS